MLAFFCGFQNASTSASKRANSHAGRNRQTPAGVDGVLVSSTEENGVDDAEVSLSLTIGKINTFLFIYLFIYLYIYYRFTPLNYKIN